jgi:hypothetical protein
MQLHMVPHPTFKGLIRAQDSQRIDEKTKQLDQARFLHEKLLRKIWTGALYHEPQAPRPCTGCIKKARSRGDNVYDRWGQRDRVQSGASPRHGQCQHAIYGLHVEVRADFRSQAIVRVFNAASLGAQAVGNSLAESLVFKQAV